MTPMLSVSMMSGRSTAYATMDIQEVAKSAEVLTAIKFGMNSKKSHREECMVTGWCRLRLTGSQSNDMPLYQRASV